MYAIFATAGFESSIEKLQIRDRQFIRNKLSNYVYPQIRMAPHFAINIKKLRNYKPATWRYKIGGYRVFYTIDEDDDLILLLVVEARSKAYRKT